MMASMSNSSMLAGGVVVVVSGTGVREEDSMVDAVNPQVSK